MAKFIRFLIYGGMVLFVLVAKAEAIRTCFQVLTSQDYYFDDIRFLMVNSALAVLLIAYLAWLSGATIDGWRMPLWSQAVPLAAMAFILWEQGWLFRSGTEAPGAHMSAVAGMSPVDRGMGAMRSIRDHLEGRPCKGMDAADILSALGEWRFSGYRSHGFGREWILEVSEGEGPAASPRDASMARPGTIFLVRDEDASSFYLSAVVSDALPRGGPAFIVDGVGKPASFAGTCAR